MPNRLIFSKSRRYSLEIAECLHSLFALEVTSPSRMIYLVSPWISNVKILSNRTGQLNSILPDYQNIDIRLANTLNLLCDKGTEVRIICRPNQYYTERFLRILSEEASYVFSEKLHIKGLLTDHFYLRGSMNFTYSGINQNEETVELTNDPEEIALVSFELEKQWEQMNV